MELVDRFDVCRLARRSHAGSVPESDRLRRTIRLRVVMRHQFRLRACHLGKAVFQQLRRPLVILLASALQQRLVRRILDERMLEQVRGLWWCSALKNQARIDEALEGVLEVFFSEFADRTCQFVGEFATDRGSDLGDPFVPGPSRSSRAISEACNVAGTASTAEGTDEAISPARSVPASSTALAISSTNNGTPSVRSMISAITSGGSKAMSLARRSTIIAAVAPPEPVQRYYRGCARPTQGGWNSGRKVVVQQDRRTIDLREHEVQELERVGSIQCKSSKITSTGCIRVQPFELPHQRRKVRSFLRCGVSSQWRKTITAGHRQQLGQQGHVPESADGLSNVSNLSSFSSGPSSRANPAARSSRTITG